MDGRRRGQTRGRGGGGPGRGVLLLALLGLGLVLGAPSGGQSCPATVVPLVQGLSNPRGLALGPDGALYLAEVGTPETGGRVSRLWPDGRWEVLLSGLPFFAHWTGETVGTTALALRRGDLYLLQGEGPGPLASALLRLPAGARTPEKVADLFAFFFAERYDPVTALQTNPTASPTVESNPFALLSDEATDRFFVVDSAANALVAVTPEGSITRLAVWPDNPVPTGLVRGPDGALLIALFSPFPFAPGSGRVDRLAPDGRLRPALTGLTMPIGLAVDRQGRLIVLEFAQGFQVASGFHPRSGRLLRLEGALRTVLADHLPYPTAVLAAPDGTFYLSLNGAFAPPGSGQVVRLIPCDRG